MEQTLEQTRLLNMMTTSFTSMSLYLKLNDAHIPFLWATYPEHDTWLAKEV